MLVAFPLPEIPFGEGNGFGICDVERLNLVDFRVWVDGQPVTPQIEAKALPDAVKAKLSDLGLLYWDRFQWKRRTVWSTWKTSRQNGPSS